MAVVVLAILQSKGGSLNRMFGGEGGVYKTRRGFEKTLFNITIALMVAFFIFSAQRDVPIRRYPCRFASGVNDLETHEPGVDMRWQAVIVVLAILAILTLTGYAAFRTTTVRIPDYGGTYREGVAGNPRYINPLLSTFNDVDRDLAALVFRGLTVADERGQIQPDLADHWEISPEICPTLSTCATMCVGTMAHLLPRMTSS